MHARLSLHTSILAPACLVTFASLAACTGATSTGSSTTGTESAALSAAESSESTYETQASQCATAFQTCVSDADSSGATFVTPGSNEETGVLAGCHIHSKMASVGSRTV